MKTDARPVVDEVAPDDRPPMRALDLPLATIVKVLVVLFALWAIYQLGAVIALVLISIVLAIALEPIVVWMEQRRIPRWFGSTLTVFVIAASMLVFIVLCESSLVAQGHQLAGRLDAAQREAAARLPPPLARIVGGSSAASPDASALARYAMTVGGVLANMVLGAVVALILTIYFLIEGRRTWAWLVAYVPKRNRVRVHETAAAACGAVLHYVAGNIATSAFAGVCVLVTLSVLHVPAALLLALLAGICDFVPVLGFIVSAVPAVLLALTVSMSTAVAVAAVYVAYHITENYLIGPKVYGGQLRLSNLAVLLAFAAGAELFGIVGALLALPVAAMYPCVEDIWLRDYLARDAVETHRRIERQER